MALSIRELSELAYGNGFTLWHYKARSDTLQDVQRPGFFDRAGDMLVAGDLVMVSAAEGCRILAVGPTDDDGSVTTAPMA